MLRITAMTALAMVGAAFAAFAEPPAEVGPNGGGFFTSLYQDHRAAQPGDVLFVVVAESTTASQSASRSNSKSGDVEVGPGTGWLDFIPEIGFGGGLSADASGSSQRRNTLSARIATTITGVTPAGNLIITGERMVKVNHDLQTIRLTGEVRPQDVRPDNTVLSEHIANAAIEYDGPDPGRPGKKVGIITRVLGWLF
ncbi:MAG: flagellar basal body L-ring protein FlgH [Armatimonadota bacterium]